MKKVLATVAALGLAVGFTANAFALDVPGKAAETEKEAVQRMPEPTAPGVALWSVTGSWVLAGAYISEGLGAPGQVAVQDDSDSNDDFYIYSFKVLPTLQVNDKISLKGELRFTDRYVFGTRATSDRNIDVYTLWMEWNSPYGKTQFGRMPAGTWGSAFLNSTRQGDRIRIFPNMLPENWGMLIFTEKLIEQDVMNGPNISDQDQDAYYIDLSYNADFGKTIGAFWIVDNAQGGASDTFVSSNFWLYGNYAFGDISIEYEVDYGFGDTSNDRDANTLGLYADLGYKMQDWKFGGLFFFASGDDDPSDGDKEGRLSPGGVGNDFNPFQIMTGDYMGFLNADKGQLHPAIRLNDGTVEDPGVWAVQGYASLAMSPAMSLSGYVGYAAALEEPSGWDDDYGLEAGIGLSYKLMDNLTYGAHFSYLWTGDYFTEGGDVDTQDVYVLSHALSMSF